MEFIIVYIFAHLVNLGFGVDVHFENAESGFFLKPDKLLNTDNILQESNPALGPWAGIGTEGGVIAVERFTVLDLYKPALIRASYGPFSTKQTVPSRYALPQFPDDYEGNDTSQNVLASLPNHVHQLELSAHLVVKEVTRLRPTVRVLIHAAGARGHHSPHVCVTILIKKDSDVLSASCTPTGAGETGGDATCLVSINIPSRWWPPHTRVTVKLPKTTASVSYMVSTASDPQNCLSRDAQGNSVFQGTPMVIVQPETPVSEVSLTLDPGGYEEISSDPLVHILVPKAPLHPGTMIHAPLYLHPPGNLPAIVFVVRCKVRNGTRIVGVEAANTAWNLTVEFNPKRSSAAVTAVLVNPSPDNETLHLLGLHEVFSWVLEVPLDAVAGETKVTWTLQYLMDALHQETFTSNGGRRMNARLVILKDVTQAIVPIAKSWSIVNTAVLTGKQVSRALKILSVSQAGNVGDVTLQSSCICTDKAALKVSTSCTSVYLDGSEVRGSQNATIIATFSHFSGSAPFTVWMPEVPLTVHIEDSKLSEIKGWKAPKPLTPLPYAKLDAGRGPEDQSALLCAIKYQQTPVEVYGRFVAIDDNSGRKSYLLSRDAHLRVTELVSHMLRVADPTVATLDNTILKGRSPGFTEVQVLSPIVGHVIGSTEVRVGADEVWVHRLHSTVISGLTLSLQADFKIPDGYDAITTITPTLTAEYQEALIDTWVEFSDGSSTSLRDVSPESFRLNVKSLDNGVVVIAPSPSEAQPRIIAIGQGEGELLQVSLEVLGVCAKHQLSLATTTARVKVDLRRRDIFDEKPTTVEETSKRRDNDKMSEIPIADAAASHHHYSLPDILHQPAVQARMHPSKSVQMTPLEVGMYILLAVFGVALVIFASSCVVYTWKVKGAPTMINPSRSSERGDQLSQDSVTNAHDWVWLGRATLERASGVGGNMALSDLNGNNNNHIHPWRDYHRFSRDYAGIVSQMNITCNPGAELEPLLSNEADTPVSCGSTTFTRPSSKFQRRVKFNNLNSDSSAEEARPPVPPHRNIGVSANLAERYRLHQSGLNAMPLHGISNPFAARITQQQEQLIVQQKDDDEDIIFDPNTKFVEVNADDFVRLRGITRSRAAQVRRATIMENPLLSSAIPDNLVITDHLDNLPSTMDYDQLLEYFSNLKESNA